MGNDDLLSRFFAPPPAEARALSELLEHLAKGPSIPEAWFAEHAPDRTLTSAWCGAPNAVGLLVVIARTADRRAFVGALAAAARAGLPLLENAEPIPARALDTVDAFCRGEADVEAVRRANDALDECILGRRGKTNRVALAAGHVARGLLEPDVSADLLVENVLICLYDAAEHGANGPDERLARKSEMRKAVVRAVREATPSPTVESVLASATMRTADRAYRRIVGAVATVAGGKVGGAA